MSAAPVGACSTGNAEGPSPWANVAYPWMAEIRDLTAVQAAGGATALDVPTQDPGQLVLAVALTAQVARWTRVCIVFSQATIFESSRGASAGE
jgi:hypothetical protein